MWCWPGMMPRAARWRSSTCAVSCWPIRGSRSCSGRRRRCWPRWTTRTWCGCMSNTAPGRFVFSPDGTQVGFLLGELAGVCADDDTAVLANVATGAETQPAMPAGMGWALAVWFGPSGTPYASMAPEPPGCAHVGQGTVASVVVSPQDYRLEAGTWVRSGSGVISQESTRGGEATLYGKVDSTPLGAGSTGLRLVVSRGSSSVTIPGALTFMWAPAAAPASSSSSPSAVSSPAPAAVSSPAVPSRRQAAQALAALLALSGTDRAAVTQAVGAVADCSPGLSQDETIFSSAASSHQALLGKLAALPDRSALPASMLQDLTVAWQASAEADQDFANWTQDEISHGCSTNYRSDASYRRPQRGQMTRLRRTRGPSPRCGRRLRTSTAYRAISTTRSEPPRPLPRGCGAMREGGLPRQPGDPCPSWRVRVDTLAEAARNAVRSADRCWYRIRLRRPGPGVRTSRSAPSWPATVAPRW